jgi:hypothetical protein
MMGPHPISRHTHSLSEGSPFTCRRLGISFKHSRQFSSIANLHSVLRDPALRPYLASRVAESERLPDSFDVKLTNLRLLAYPLKHELSSSFRPHHRSFNVGARGFSRIATLASRRPRNDMQGYELPRRIWNRVSSKRPQPGNPDNPE